jgi:hypothetical protein
VGVTVNGCGLLAVLPEVVIEITPVVAPGITNPTKLVPVFETTTAVTPPMLNAVGLPRLVPVTVTRVPTGPCAGLKVVIAGAAAHNAGANAINTIIASRIRDLIGGLLDVLKKTGVYDSLVQHLSQPRRLFQLRPINLASMFLPVNHPFWGF